MPEQNIHNAYAFQCQHLIAEIFAHAANLAVQSLRQYDTEFTFTGCRNLARRSHGVQYRHACCHPLYKRRRQRLVHGHNILLLVMVPGTQNLVHDIAVIRQKQ